ncbi:MAG: hypothetical protein CML20_07205 [Rheinheimera sp.]|nr:hypothetical protein [Rheinheimera sp.]
MNYQKRNTIDLAIEDFKKTETIHYELLRFNIKGENSKPIDIGAIAYSKRMAIKDISPRDFLPRGVILSSLKKERLLFIKELANYIASKERKATQIQYLKVIHVFDWLDENGHSNCLKSPKELNKAYFAYTNHLFKQLLSHDRPIGLNRARYKQREFELIISLTFPDNTHEIYSGVQKLRMQLSNNDIKDKSLVEGELNKHWEVNFALFKQMKDFAMADAPMPFKLTLPDFNSYWFPSNSDAAVQSPFLEDIKLSRYYNYQTGEFFDYDLLNIKLKEEYKRQNRKFYHFGKDYKNSKNSFQAINEDKRSYWRRQNGLLAMKAFIQLFRIMTCANQQTIIDLSVSDSIQKDFTQNEFKSIKFRAGYREVSYRLHRNGYKLYLAYLELREWLLNGKECTDLFFTFGEQHKSSEPRKLNQFSSRSHYRVLERKGYMRPPVSMIKDNELRNAKSVYFKILGYSPKETAGILNHSEVTSEKSYSSISDGEQVKEYKKYWGSLKSINIAVNEGAQASNESTAAGHCSNSERKPQNIMQSPPIEPDCKTPQGCLFCQYYVVHTKSDGLKKLFSLLFIIETVFLKTPEWEHAYALFSLMVLRIKEIIKQITLLSIDHKGLVNKAKEEVYESNELTSFWDNRLQQYIDSGVVI